MGQAEVTRSYVRDQSVAKPIHPDRLDAVAASQDASARHDDGAADAPAAGKDEVSAVIEKVLANGVSRLPKKRRPKAIALASIALLLVRYRAYTEAQLNDVLKPWLAASGLEVDHAACRRYLIDYGFVKRDRAGQRYIADYAKIEALLSADALEFAKGRVSGSPGVSN